ncbi:Site-specific recombinase XerD [Brevibacterium sandarakinum]|uniref:Site-specific recombinase XerD n=1 Tax=Brevibacterium sandarakinum TaxID=629680 RepID=A0A1H1NSN8_BRESA|nr:site-specific integrase [Brevibacterium sandarakinum]SDS01978.1 Site-specific recombinase XerD [Brevibacterium sandarakinum]
MGRPRQSIGTYGTINVTELRPGKWRARTRYRFADGKARQVEKYGTTKPKAESFLKQSLLTIEAGRGGELRPTTPLRILGQMFLEHKRGLERSEGTLETYGYAVTAHIIPRIGDLTIAEAKPDRLQKFLNTVHKESGHGATKNCRSTLSGMMSLAVSNGAISRNPVRDVERIAQPKGKKGAAAVSPDDLPDLMGKLRQAPTLVEQDTVELLDFMVASGWRVGEACALKASSIDFSAGTAEVVATNVRVKGRGIVRQTVPKTDAAWRVTPLPGPTMDLLRRRYERLKADTTLLFPTAVLTLRDPSNTQRELRDVRDSLGYPKLSTHSFRKTAATMLDRAGMSATEIAAFLGHANPSMTQDVYMNTLKGSTRAGAVMQDQLKGLI